MLKQKSYILYFLRLSFLYAITLSSCISSKKVIYFNDLTDSTVMAKIRVAATDFENIIQKNDQLSIIFAGSNVNDLTIFNGATNTIQAGATSASPATGYLVEADGNIKFPLIGKIKAEGLTRIQLENLLTDLLKDYTKNPVVNVRFLNYSFSVLGEVASPGKFQMITERTTILDAISAAKDLTTLGRRENVLVVREEQGKRSVGRLNLLSKDIFNSPFFYLKTNDVIYVEPVNSKFISRNGSLQYLSIAAVGFSLILTLINLRK